MATKSQEEELQTILLEIANAIGHRELIAQIEEMGKPEEQSSRKEEFSSAKK